MKLRILLADDHELIRRGLCALLQKREGWEVCGEASDGRQTIEMAKKSKLECCDRGHRHATPQRFGYHAPVAPV